MRRRFSGLAGDALKEGLTVVGLLAVLFWHDWRLAIYALVGMPAAIYPLVLLGRHLRGWRGQLALRWTLAGFIALLLAYVGSRFVVEVLLGRGA